MIKGDTPNFNFRLPTRAFVGIILWASRDKGLNTVYPSSGAISFVNSPKLFPRGGNMPPPARHG